MVAAPSARRARATSSDPTFLSTISPVAITSPVVSTAVIIMTTIIDRIAAIENCGQPKWNGVVTPTQSDSPTADRSTRPNGTAASVPSTSPASTATVARNPRNSRWISTITASVPRASPR